MAYKVTINQQYKSSNEGHTTYELLIHGFNNFTMTIDIFKSVRLIDALQEIFKRDIILTGKLNNEN